MYVVLCPALYSVSSSSNVRCVMCPALMTQFHQCALCCVSCSSLSVSSSSNVCCVVCPALHSLSPAPAMCAVLCVLLSLLCLLPPRQPLSQNLELSWLCPSQGWGHGTHTATSLGPHAFTASALMHWAISVALCILFLKMRLCYVAQTGFRLSSPLASTW